MTLVCCGVHPHHSGNVALVVPRTSLPHICHNATTAPMPLVPTVHIDTCDMWTSSLVGVPCVQACICVAVCAYTTQETPHWWWFPHSHLHFHPGRPNLLGGLGYGQILLDTAQGRCCDSLNRQQMWEISVTEIIPSPSTPLFHVSLSLIRQLVR